MSKPGSDAPTPRDLAWARINRQDPSEVAGRGRLREVERQTGRRVAWSSER